MNIEEALNELRPYQRQLPQEALNFMRSHWHEAEAPLLTEIDRCIALPLEEEHSALFLYAIYLCAEMRCEAVFERYIAICRLPTLLMDALLGDVLTEHLPEMLARTCGDQVEQLKALMEDEAVYEFARSAGLETLYNLALIDTISQAELGRYCMELLSQRLEKRPSYAWDAAITIAEYLCLTEALPLIETAYQRGWADPQVQSFASVKSGMVGDQNNEKLKERHEKIVGFNTEREMDFFVRNWSEDKQLSLVSDADLLHEPQAARRQRQLLKSSKVGRNDPCPCGSGKKYKKCCIDLVSSLKGMDNLNDAVPLNQADEWIGAGYYYLEQDWRYKTLTCWRNAWQEVQKILPDSVLNPEADECDGLFTSCVFFSNWLVDYQTLLENNLDRDPVVVQNGLLFCQQVVERFPDMRCSFVNNFVETTAYLMSALGKSAQAFSLLEKMIKEQPNIAQGYVVLAALLSMDASRFNLRPDFARARQLLLQAQQNATDCEGWDVELRLDDLKEL